MDIPAQTPPLITQIPDLSATPQAVAELVAAPVAAPTGVVEPELPPPQSPAPAIVAGSMNGLTRGIADVLVEQGVVSVDLLKEVQAESITTGKQVEDLLLERGYINDIQLSKAKGKYYNIPYIALGEIGASPEALNQVPEGVARRYLLLPFAVDKSKRTLSIAMANPLDLRAIDFVEKKTGYQIVRHLATATDLETAINER